MPEIHTDDARVRLDHAVAALTRPTMVTLSREDAQKDSIAAAALRDDRAAEQELSQRHARYLRAGHTAQAVRTLERLIELRLRIADRRARQQETAAEVPSLLDQLEAEVGASSSGPGEGASAGPYRSVIAIEAAELLQVIQRVTGARRGPSLNEDVQGWAAARGEEDGAADLAEGWVASIADLLNPPKRFQRPGACPQCGNRTAHVDNGSEMVRTTAIEFEPDLERPRARCRRCPARWVGDTQLRQLAKALEQSLTEQEASSNRTH